MFVIWSGWGILTVLFALIGGLIGIFAAPAAGPVVGIAVATIVAAVANFYMARWLGSRGRKELIDPQTGGTVVLKDGSSLFFIPMRYWTYIIVILGIAMELFAMLGHSTPTPTP